MVVSPPETAGTPPVAADAPGLERTEVRQRFVAIGGILGALAASSCCIVPLLLFSLGISGAWIGNLTALAPYKPLFVTGTAGLLGYGFYLVYGKPSRACAACARPIPSRLVQLAFWIATLLVLAAFAVDYIPPSLFRA
jgi:mercuric ion transport protein